MSARRLPLLLLAVGVATIAASVPAEPAALVWNASASVPIGLYRVARTGTLRPGEIVAVRPSTALAHFMARRRYLGLGALLMKPVGAMAGHVVCRIGLTVTIDATPVAAALRADRLGRPLPVWSGCRRLTPNTIFLLARGVPESFDGRYFGPVATSRIIGRAMPIWTRS